MKFKITMVLFLFLVQQMSVMADITLEVDCNSKDGIIKQGLVGASQGGNAFSYLNNKIVNGLKGLPLKTVRLEMLTGALGYKLYNPKTKQWNWTVLDKEIDRIQKSGAKVVINFFGTPTFMSSNPKAKVPIFAPPVDFKAYADYCAEIVRHVNIDKKYGIKYWEFWNEPSGNYFWSAWRKKDKGGFFKLYAKVAKAIKAVDPSILVGGIADNAYYQEHYATFFEFAKTEGVPIDFLTIHWYGEWNKKGINNVQWYNDFATKLENTYKKFFGKEVPIFYSEWNLPAESKNKYSAEQIAAFAGTALYWMQTNPYVKAAMLFRVQHYKDPYSSLLDKKYKPIMLWNVMKMFSMLPKESVQTSSDNSDTKLLAATNGSVTGIMISRYAFEDDCAALTINGLEANKKYQASVYNLNSLVKNGKLLPVVEQTVSADQTGKLEMRFTLEKFSCVYVALNTSNTFITKNTLSVKNWKGMSSGKMSITADKETNSAKFTVNFPKNIKDRWAYPSMKINRADSGASKLTFEMKLVTNPKQEKYRNTLVMLQPVDKKIKHIWKSYHLSNSSDFQTITIDLKKTPAYHKTVSIGLNFVKANTATFYIRNVKFIK